MTLAVNLGFAALVLLLVIAIWRVAPKRRRPSKRACFLAACLGDDYISPIDPRLPAHINAWLDGLAAIDPQLAPVFAPGVDRLRKAIRDEQQDGDEA
jgi:hypothetical protein